MALGATDATDQAVGAQRRDGARGRVAGRNGRGVGLTIVESKIVPGVKAADPVALAVVKLAAARSRC